MRTLAVSCFGKLPLHREFLRLGLGSPAAAWVVRWLEGAHDAWSRAGTTPATTGVVRFAAAAPGGLAAGVVRQSSDGLRRHPVTFFVVDPALPDASRWHLVPLAAAGTWAALATLLDTSFPDLDGLGKGLAAGVPPLALDEADAAYRQALAASSASGAWHALTGATADAARHLAFNLMTVGRAQREAQSEADGVSVAAPLPEADAALAHAGLWMELLATAAGGRPARPAVLLGGDPLRAFLFYRPAEGLDLAAVLSSPAMAPVDDLAEPWQTLPPGEAAVAAAVEAIVVERGPLAALAAHVRAAAGA